MRSWIKEACGVLLVFSALGVLFFGITELRFHDYVAAIVMTIVGLSLLGAGIELLRPTVGE